MDRALNRAAIGELLQLLAADEEGGAWRGERQDNKGDADIGQVTRFLPTLAHKWHTKFGYYMDSAYMIKPCFRIGSRGLRWGG